MAKQTMSEIIETYNALAIEQGKDPVDSFKNLKAAQAALAQLQAPTDEQAEEELDPNREIIPADDGANSGPKYNTAGKRGPTQGIGAFCKGLITEGKTNDEILELVAVAFPTAKTTRNCVAYYRAKLKTVVATAEATEEIAEEEEVAA
jgi:hypothetical protein